MGWDDQMREKEASYLESLVVKNDNLSRDVLQDELVRISQQDPEGFNKTVDLFKQMNERDRAAGLSLPEVQVTKEWFGFGPVEQVVIKDVDGPGGRKEEVFETEAHRQKEASEHKDDMARGQLNWQEASRWRDMPDYQKDSSRRATRAGNTVRFASGDTISDHRQNDGQTRTNLTPEELQRLIDEGKF